MDAVPVPEEGESSRTWERYNLRRRVGVPIWSELMPKKRCVRKKPEGLQYTKRKESHKSAEEKAEYLKGAATSAGYPVGPGVPESIPKKSAKEDMEEYFQRAKKSILKKFEKIKLPEDTVGISKNRTEITNAGAAAMEMENWEPYFSRRTSGLDKITLKCASWATEKLALEAAPSVVGLKSFTVGGKHLFTCCGTIVKSSEKIQQIVTVANLVKKSQDIHELAESLKITVYLRKSVTFSGDLLYYDFHYNICVIQFESPMSLHAKKFSSHIKATNFDNSFLKDVVALSRNHERQQLTLSISTGKIVPRNSIFDCEELLLSTCKISKAAVGGPLMNMDGDFIGMNYYHKAETPFMPCFIVLKCLQQFKYFGKVVKPWHGLQVRTLYAEGGDAFENIQDNIPHGSTGVIIEKIRQLSSSKVDLTEGDIINRVNGICFSSAAEFGGILLDLATSHLLDDPSSSLRYIKIGVVGCERERTVLVDMLAPNGLNRWPFPEPIIVQRYVNDKLDNEEWYSLE